MLPLNKRNIYENHTDIINKLISTLGYRTYLEIGVANPDSNYNLIKIKDKESCDISDKYPVTYQMTSDEMFKKMSKNKKYDIIFIDGMHNEEYCDRDISNSLKHLNKGGIICVHDTIPISYESSLSKEEYPLGGTWSGDVWKSIVKLNNTGIQFYTIDDGDFGLTIIIYAEGCENIDLTSIKCTGQYFNYFTNNGFIFNCLNLNGRYALHVIDILDFENIFNIPN